MTMTVQEVAEAIGYEARKAVITVQGSRGLEDLQQVFNVIDRRFGPIEDHPAIYAAAVHAAIGKTSLADTADEVRAARKAYQDKKAALTGVMFWENVVGKVSEVQMARDTGMSRTTLRALLRSGLPR